MKRTVFRNLEVKFSTAAEMSAHRTMEADGFTVATGLFSRATSNGPFYWSKKKNIEAMPNQMVHYFETATHKSNRRGTDTNVRKRSEIGGEGGRRGRRDKVRSKAK